MNAQIVTGVVNVAVGINRSINNPIDSVQICYIDGSKVLTDTHPVFVSMGCCCRWWLMVPFHTILAISYDPALDTTFRPRYIGHRQ